MARAALTKKRLLGIDRSGGPPPGTQKGEPLRPFTIPNAVSYLRLALLPVFVAIAFASEGRDVVAAALYFLIAWGDQLDGLLARVTGQYSRLGALMDPLIDRLVVIAGVVVVWHFELLPRWALAVLVAREVFMLGAVLLALRMGLDLHINWLGRIAVWPTMAAFGAALVGWDGLDEWLLYIGLAGSFAATFQYGRDARRELRARGRSSATP